MYHIIPFLFFPLLCLLVSFTIGALRRSSRPGIVALKSSPMGCLTALFLMLLYFKLISWIYSLLQFPETVMQYLFTALMFAILALSIYFLTRWNHFFLQKSRERSPSPKYPAPSSGHGYAIIYFLALGGISFVALGASIPYLDRHYPDTYESNQPIVLSLPREIPVKIAITSKTTNSFLGETAFRLTVIYPDGASYEYPDFIQDPGGMEKIFLYQFASTEKDDPGILAFGNGMSPQYLDLKTRDFGESDHLPHRKDLWKNIPEWNEVPSHFHLIGTFSGSRFQPAKK